jgi:hypothetical protein
VTTPGKTLGEMTTRVRLLSSSFAVPCPIFNGRLLWMSTQALAQNLHIVTAAGNGVKKPNEVPRGVVRCNGLEQKAKQIIVVGATDSTDRLAGFSDFGPCVDLFG